MDSPPPVETAARPGSRSAPRPRTAPPGPDASRWAHLVPAPVSADPSGSTYTLAPDATIQTSPDAVAVGGYLAELLRRSTGYALPVVEAANPTGGGITLLLTGADADPGLSAEGYELDVTADTVTVRAGGAAGLFYGVQTLRQLLPPAIESATVQPGPWTVPGGRVVDHPRFAYRGAMLDVSRHFFPVADVKRYLDELALYKINHLHLHLTDDQGWRIAIDAWPRLATVGGATKVDGGAGGCYTKAQYREIVAHAAARHITIVPEIDLPGHTNAALTAYGQLAPDGVAPPPYTGTDVGFSALSVAGDLTYDFIDEVLGEVAALTPGPYLHIGGDEAWTLSKTEYAAFMNRIQPLVAAKGKTVMGWHQVAVADHTPGRVVQFWGTSPSEPALAEAVRRGARVVLSPGNRAYLDMKYSARTSLGKDWAGCVEVREAYDWDPGSYLNDVPADAVLGVEAPLWTETIATMGQVEFMTFPRLPALAELGWSPASTHDWAGFRSRLAAHAPRWIAAGIAFHPSPQIPWLTPATVPAAPAHPVPVTPVSAVPATPSADPAGSTPADGPADSPSRVIGAVAADPGPAGAGSGPAVPAELG